MAILSLLKSFQNQTNRLLFSFIIILLLPDISKILKKLHEYFTMYYMKISNRMAKKDIFKIDNYLIKFGVFFLIVGSLSVLLDPRSYNDLLVTKDNIIYTFENYEGRTLEEIQQELGSETKVTAIKTPVIRPSIAISGLILLIVGIVFRKKENKIISIWDALERTTEGKLRDLEVSLGISRAFILENLKHINAQQGAYYVYISAKDIIVDGKLIEEHVVSLSCSGCGNNINKKVSLAHLDDLACTYCGAAISVVELTKLRNNIIEENEIAQAARSNSSSFNFTLFSILLLLFWPAAIMYYMSKKTAASKQTEASMASLQQLAQKLKT